ncbi:nuclear transport factor 2 family protein [Actinomadura rudentiformis]|uniref:Nuclear transport factor 2 family protein n=1 Tax=Actinomadura rudentiformis TaxID=359158 RepID=A0A6H9YV41_9ACTN|nr:nuclear transport factor 2 family protein [Actinomadura rudentiformis]KAB2346080.1 nuclear transport factor 2 family protein [Actinomadura rudentiformis]
MTTNVQDLTDRAELTDLLTRQGLWLDEQRFDDADTIFTPDATVETQSGRSQGLQALAARARRVHSQFERTQHVISNVLIDLDGDEASVRANLVATFVRDATSPEPDLAVGERYRFGAVRTPAGWRFSSVTVTPVWRTGEPPVATPDSDA